MTLDLLVKLKYQSSTIIYRWY